jgi:hypothetical protein
VTHATIDCIGKGKTWRHVKATPAATVDAKSEAADETKHDAIRSDDAP